MEEELEEEQANSEAATDKAKKAQLQADSLNSELATVQSNLQQAESNKSSLEKQVLYILFILFYISINAPLC